MATKKQNSDQSETPQNAYFLSLELEDVRCFGEKQKIDFSDGNGNWKKWTIILGDNGTGKTSILQSLVAMAPDVDVRISPKEVTPKWVCYDSYLHDWLPYRENRSYLKANLFYEIDSNKKNSSYFCEKKDYIGASYNHLPDKNKIRMICLAYGTTRKIGESMLSGQNEEDLFLTLFSETASLINPEEWLLQTDYASSRNSRFKELRRSELNFVKEILIKILPDVNNIRVSEKELRNKRTPQPIVEFKTPYGWVEAKDLSLGYRTSMAWMVDFASRMFELYPKSENPLAEPAVVLIDEIDLHLHPKWQRDLLDWLSDLCPNTQFIVTTHSPLIVQAAAARDANFAVCRREGDHVVIDQSVDAVRGWRADQILSSDLFDVPKRDSELEKWLKEKETILSKPKLTKKDESRLAELEEKIGFLPISENGKDDEAMKIIREAADWVKTNSK
ncbi:MAG TPA: AAA family ATPase [Pyrinomonadaceae bacterium]|nr:AAA family ATPase [Pyrinomonadaceae bacterium]